MVLEHDADASVASSELPKFINTPGALANSECGRFFAKTNDSKKS